MHKTHIAAIIGANVLGLALLTSILFGRGTALPAAIGGDRSVRDVGLALWTFLVPAWFMVEALWFGPAKGDQVATEQFLAAQQKSRVTWTVIGGAVAIMIGATAPKLIQ